MPGLVGWLRAYPHEGGDLESFFYWSKEFFGSGKPVIGVTHVGIARPSLAGGTATIVAGKQILATHYSQTSLGLTMALPGAAGSPTYLVYVNRSALDVLSGMVGTLARGIMERRLSRQAPVVVSGLRTRLESGPPPATPGPSRPPGSGTDGTDFAPLTVAADGVPLQGERSLPTAQILPR